jgi:CheY-like chemotaxis protein
MAKLLLVDDEKAILESLELILNAEGHETQAVGSAQAALDALAAAKEDKPDLVIADIVMPGMSGLELLSIMRANPRYAKLPVLFISASITPEMEVQVGQLAFVSFLRKPFQVEAMIELVNELCG